MPVPEKRVYENKQGSFITGIDVISKVSGSGTGRSMHIMQGVFVKCC